MPAPAHDPLTRPLAIGLIRISEVGDRQGERFVSPIEQRATIEWSAQRENLELLDIWEEMDISGGDPLDDRTYLSRAIQYIERDQAHVLVVAYFDRLFRDLPIQMRVLERIFSAGGRVYAGDSGWISIETASDWLSTTTKGMVAHYHRLITREKTHKAKLDAVRRGVPPFPNIVPGYERGADGRLKVVEAEAPIVAQAFQMRADGASLSEIRAYLRDNGIQRSYRATQTLLQSRLVLGELHYGKSSNLHGHPPIVDRDLWRQVQRIVVPRGPKPSSDRLLARLGILVCGSCGARLVNANVWNKPKLVKRRRYPIYRCGMPGDCPAAVTISATLVEARVVAKVRELAEADTGRASMDSQLAVAVAELEARQERLRGAIRAFDGIDPEHTNATLLELQAEVDAARKHVRLLEATAAPARELSASRDWDRLSREAQRNIIRLALTSVRVLPASMGERLEFHIRGQ